MQRVNVSLLCLLSLSLAGSVFAQQAANPAGVASLQNYSGAASFGSGSYFNIRHMSGDGVGYQGGYSQIGVFTPFWLNDDAFIAADARLMVTNNSQFGGNVGGVARQYLSGLDRIVGAYGYFDTDQSSLSYRYNQASFGLETLGQWWDLRGNGYVALGSHDNFVSNGAALCVTGNPYFGGNNILFAGQQAQYREQSLSGGDFEFGVPVSPATPWLRAYAGAYAYTSTQLPPIASDNPVYNHTIKTPVGARLRLDAWISNDLLLGINATTDAVWGTNLNFVADWRFSGFGPTRYFPQFTTRERMLAPVQRNWRIATDQYVTAVNHDVVAVDPSTGKPYFITFIDNLKTPTPGGGTGTFEDPYNSFNHPNGIPQANIILVEKGTSTATNPYLGSMTLFDNQRLLGQGAITEKLALSATYGNCTIDSVFDLPTTGSGANHPFVQSATGLPPVTLANNNEVAGFTIVDQNGNVIGGDPANINIHDVTILRSTTSSPAIYITNLTGNNNIIKNINISTPGGIGNNEGGGIYLQSGVGGANLTMTNVFMNSAAPYTPGGQQPFGIWLNAPAAGPAPNGGGAFTATLTNVHTDGNVVGLRLTENGQNMNVTLNNVTASNNSGRGIEVSGIGGQVTLTANTAGSPLVASGNGGNNLNVNMYSGGNFTGTFANAVFNNSTGGSGVLVNEIGGTATLNLTGTQMNNNQLDGLGLTTSGGGTINVTGSNDQFVGNSRNGIYNVANANATITETFTGSTLLNGNHVDGVYYNLTSGSSLTGTYTGAMVNNNLTSAFYGLQNNSTVNLTISNTQATGSGKDGFFLSASNGSSFTGTLQNDTFSNSGANGMLVTLNGSPSSTGTFNLSSTHVDGNATNGVAFTANNQSLYTLSAVNSTFNGNKSSGITGSILTGSTANVSTSATSSISGNTENGVYVTSATGSNFVGAFDNTAINNNINGGGINLYLSASPASTLSLTGTTSLNQNGTNGLRVTALSGTVFTPTLSGTSIQQNGQDGVKLNVLSGSSIGTVANTGSFTNVLIRDNKLNGVESVVSGVGSVSDLVFTNAQITNTSGIAPQQIGYLYTVTGGGQLTASFGGNTSLANEAQNAINGTVVGTGSAGSSVANITLDGTNASGSGNNNALLRASGGGLLNFTAQNGSTFSNSVAGSGLIVSATDVNTVANVELDTIAANGNVTGTGFGGLALTGATLNACVETSSFSNNLLGLKINVQGAGSQAFYGVGTTTAGTGDTVNSNTQQGLLASVTSGGVLNYRSIGTTYNLNGTGATKYDGVDMRVDATGNTNSTLRALFDGGSANTNGRDGFHFGGLTDGSSTNKANLTVNLNNGVNSLGNGRDSVNFNVSGAKTAYLLMDTVTPPVLSGPMNLNYAGTTNAVATLTGTYQWNGYAGNGLTADFHGATTAVFSLDGQGTSTADNNTLGGISVNMDNVKNASVLIKGFSDISGNKGGDGIYVSMNDAVASTGAIQIQGVAGGTTMTGNAGKGVNVQLANVNLVNGIAATLPTITGLATTGPGANQSFNACLPAPVTLATIASAVPATGLTVNNFTVTNSASRTGTGGIYVDGTNATIASGGSISGNTISNMNGDGIQLQLHNTVLKNPTANGFKFNSNSSTSNSGNGINIDLVNATMNSLSLTGTTNASSNGMDGLRINLVHSSMTPTTGPATFTASSNGTNGVEINSTNGSNIFLDLGQLTANSNVLGAGFLGTATTGASGGSTLNISLENPSSLSSNGTQGLGLTVTGAGSTSNFNVNNLADNTNKKQGLLATVSNGGTLNYRSADSTYNGNGTAAGSDGVSLQVDGATSVLHALFTADTASSNSRDGFHISGLNGASTVNGANVTVNLSGITASGNTRDSLNMDTATATSSYLLMDPTAPSILNGAANLNFANVNKAIASLTGTFAFNNSAASNGLTANFSNAGTANTAILYVNDTTGTSTASGNALGGLNVIMSNATNSSVLINGFKDISNNNGGDGIAVTMSRTTPGTGALELQGVAAGTTVNGNSGNGINVQLTNMNLVSGYNPTLPTVTGLTTGSNILSPAYLGALPAPTTVTVPTSVPATAFSVNDFKVGNSAVSTSGNGLGGIIVDGTNTTFTTGGGSISNNSVWGSKGGDGIQLQLHNSALVTTADSFKFNSNSSTSNSGNGINIDLVNATMNSLSLTGTTNASSNGMDGLRINLVHSSMTPTTGPATFNASSNGTNGVEINSTNGSNIFLDLGKLTANSNVLGAGFLGTATTGASGGSTLNIALENPSSLSSNGTQGLALTVTGAGSSSNFNVNKLTDNTNKKQGLLAVVSGGGVLNYRSANTTYNGNGTASASDGVNLQVDGATSVLHALFTGDTANGNSQDGFHISGLNGASTVNGANVTVNLSGITASGNTRDSLNMDTATAASSYLLMDPTAPSTLNGAANLNFANVNNAIASLTGTFAFNNSAASNGLTANFSNAGTANTAILYVNDTTGNSTASGNALGGLNVIMSNATNSSVLINGFKDISNNHGGDGIAVTMSRTTPGTGALELQGVAAGTTVNGNSGNGINVQLTNMNLVSGYSPVLPTVTGLTTGSNITSPAYLGALPAPTTVAVPTSVPATAFSVNKFKVGDSAVSTSGNGLGGIIVDGTNTTFTTGGGSISNNSVWGSKGGDGIQLQLHNTALVTTADSFKFNGNSSSFNSGNGINIDLVNATMNSLSLTGTTNASSNGMDGLRINLVHSSMTPTTGPATFTASNNATNGVEINSTNGSNIFLDLGKLTANSNVLGAGFLGTATTGASGGSTLNISLENPSSLSSNGTQGLGLTVTGAGSTSNFNVNGLADNTNKKQGLVATVSNGGTLNYRSANSTYNGNGTAVGSDGVSLQVDGATSVLHALFTGDTANNNSRDGFHISGLNGFSSVNGANVTVNMSGITSTGNTRFSLDVGTATATSSYLLMDPTAPSTLSGAANLNFANVNNAIASLTGTFAFDNGATTNGLLANFSNSGTANTAILYVNDTTGNSTASGNALGGLNVIMSNATNSSVLINGFKDISNNNGGDGIAVTMSRTTPGTGALELQGVAAGTTVNGNSGNGINVQLTNMNLVSGYSPVLPTVTGLTTGNNILSPAYLGALPAPTTVTVPTSVPATAFSVNKFKVGDSAVSTSGNGLGGIIVDGTNTTFTTGGGSISNNSVWGSKGGDGIQLKLHNSVLATTADGFAFTNNSSVGNSGNGINIDLVKATMNNLNLVGTTTVTSNTLDGLHINLNGSSMTQTGNAMATGVVVNASSNATNGVYLNAVNGSNLFLDVNQLTANSNTGGAGLSGTALSGSTLNVCLDTGSLLSSNSLQGMNITVGGANSVGNFNVDGATVDGNTKQGLLATVTNTAQLNYRSIGTSYNLNGTGATKYDGVDLRVDGSSGAAKSTILSLFDSSTAITNGRDGFHVGGLTDGALSTNGAIVTVSLQNSTKASGNGRDALNFNVPGATSANLLMDTTTSLVGTTHIDVDNVTTQVVLQLVGASFNNNAGGDGLAFNFSNLQTAFVSLNGLGTSTLDNNTGGNGLSVTMNNVVNGSVLVQNYQSISGNKLDGVMVSMTDVTNGAIAVQGTSPAAKTTMSGNGHDAVDIQLTRTGLTNNLGGVSSVPGLTLGSNQGPPNSLNCLPAPTSLPLASLNLFPPVALTVDSLNVSGSGATGGTGGIIVNGTDSTIVANNAFFTNNKVTASANGGGIGVTLTNNNLINLTVDTVTFDHNTVGGPLVANGNNGDGISFKLINTAFGGTITAKNLFFTNNTVSHNTGNGIVDSIFNTATANVTADSQFLNGNTVSNNAGNGIAFTLTDTAVGRTVSANNLQFNSNTVTGNTGIGILENITNGAAALSLQASGTQIRSNTVNSNQAGGIMDTITNTIATTTVADNRQISFNTVNANVGFGIKESIINLTGKTTTANGLSISNNTVTGNTLGQGIMSTLGGGSAVTANNVLFFGDTSTGNSQNGMALLWTNVTGSGLNFNSSNSSNNLAANGLLLNLTNSSLSNVTLNSSVMSGNKTNGLYALLNASSITTISGLNTTANSNKQNGLDVVLTNASSMTGGTFTNATITGNTLDGVHADAIDGTKSTFGTTFTNGTISNNKSDGVDVSLASLSTANMAFNNVTIGNTSGKAPQQNGLFYDIAATGGTFNATFTGGTISNNAVDAINGTLVGTGTANQTRSTISLNGTTANGSGSTGALFTLDKASLLNFTMTNASSISGSGADGVQINAQDTSTRVVGTFANSFIYDNGATGGGNGLTGNFDNDATALLNFTTMQIENSALGGTQWDGVMLNVNQITATANTDVVANFTSNTDLSNNAFFAVESNVTGVAAVPTNGAHITFNTVTADNSGLDGVALNVNNGGLTTFTATGSSISGSGLNGMYISATDADTLAAVSLTDSALNNNGTLGFGGDGLNGTAALGATLNVYAYATTPAAMSFSGNAGDGIDVIVGDAGSRADIDLHNTVVGLDAAHGLTGNTLNGLSFQTLDGAELNLRAYNTTFNGNGFDALGASDGGAGLLGTVDNTIGVDTVARVRIISGSADGNGGDGYSLNATNTSSPLAGVTTLTAQFQDDSVASGGAGLPGVLAQNNGGYGLNFNASNATPPGGGIVGNLLMTGNSTLVGNGLGTVNVNMVGADQAIVGLSGTFDGSTTGDGIHIDLQNISGLALVALQGPGEVNGNAGDGIDVNLTKVHNGGVFIGGFTNVSNNGSANNTLVDGSGNPIGQDGIQVTMNDVGHDFGVGAGVGAVTIDGHNSFSPANIMSVSNNTGNGVNVTVNNGSIINNNAFNSLLSTTNVKVVNYTPPDQPMPTPLPNPLLTTGTISVGTALGVTFPDPLSIQNLNMDSNGILNPAVGSVGATNTSGNGILLTVDTAAQILAPVGTDPISINHNTITNTGAGAAATTHNGVQFVFDNGAIITAASLASNQITGNNGDGFQMLTPNFDNIPSPPSPVMALNFTGNVIDSNSVNGVDIMLQNGTMPKPPTLNLKFVNNDVSNNTSNGLLLDIGNRPVSNGTASVTFQSSLTANTINGFTKNEFNNNGGMGAFIESTNYFASNQSKLTLTVNGAGGQNQFNGNENAGLGLYLTGSTIANGVSIQNAQFNSNKTNGAFNNFQGSALNPFNGAGFAAFVYGTTDATFQAQMNNTTFGGATNNTIATGNVGDGLRITTIYSGLVDTMTVKNSTFSTNKANGIEFLRDSGSGVAGPYINNVLIQNNTIQSNTNDGISLAARFGVNGADTYTIEGNTIGSETVAALGNGNNGIQLQAVFDANITAYIGQDKSGNFQDFTKANTTANIISNNKGDGINMTDNPGASDTPTVSAYISNNKIDSNSGNGIFMNSIHDLGVGIAYNSTTATYLGQASNLIMNNGGNGIDLRGFTPPGATDQIQYNAIKLNGGDGIAVRAAGSLSVNIAHQINTVLIPGGGLTTLNAGGIAGIFGNGTKFAVGSGTGDGIKLDATGGYVKSTINDNDIINNSSNGIAVLATYYDQTSTSNVSIGATATNNINSNQLRGISVVNGSNSRLTMRIDNNNIAFSRYEGVYIVNTSTAGQFAATNGGTVQGVDSFANSTLAVDATWNNSPRMALIMNNNGISSSGGGGSSIGASGLVVRVGSSDAPANYSSVGNGAGFATNLTSATMGGLGIGSVVNGGIGANITNNVFTSDAGNDVTFQAYKSTTDPATTGGTWYNFTGANPPTPASKFQITSYQADPLSRLDLNFTGNSGQAINPASTTFGGANAAMYNNNESVFKSRINNQPGLTGDTANGPFNSGTRDRNITRLPSQLSTPGGALDIAAGVDEASVGFLYPGTGASTFRVNGGVDGGNSWSSPTSTPFNVGGNSVNNPNPGRGNAATDGFQWQGF